MTFFSSVLSINFCHWLWSMTFGHKWYVHNQNYKSMILCFGQLLMGLPQKLSLISQWHFLLREWVITEKCHLLINDNFSQFNGPVRSCLKQRIMHVYGHTTYGHMSLTTVNDKSLWTKLKKVSLTLVNDKKIVIDHGQWQKKLSLTESDLYRGMWVISPHLFAGFWRAAFTPKYLS